MDQIFKMNNIIMNIKTIGKNRNMMKNSQKNININHNRKIINKKKKSLKKKFIEGRNKEERRGINKYKS